MATNTDQMYGTVGIGFMNFQSSLMLDVQDNTFMAVKNRFDTYAESIHRIVQTAPLDRPHEPQVGCILRRLLFDPNDFYLQRAADFALRTAISLQEPRLDILKISILVMQNEKRLKITLVLMEKESQARFALDEEVQL